MEKVNTDTLRSVSSKWSLGGDNKLLDLLQNIHQKVITKCTETNTKLDELINKVDRASIDLQNVNNKFMALSNTQFIERRVYDDDIDIAPPVEPPKEPPKIIDPNEELENLKQSIQTFESMHEAIQILESDSSDDEDEGRLVLKLKNVYAHRPLPYIIGSEHWRTKWHAGLVVEDSDTDSADLKNEPGEEYSDSEPEITDTQTDKQIKKDTWISSPVSVEASVSTSLTKPAKPADIAAELAKRLGGDTIPPPPPMEAMPEPTTKKVYRPEQPIRANIFSNEPPPLEQVESDSDEDIFAELHRNSYRAQPIVNVVDELFGDVETVKPTITQGTQELSDDESELFAPKPTLKEKSLDISESGFKKPVGGISLFGSNKNSNSIGAAILKRQQAKSSDEESDSSENIQQSNTKPKPSEKETTNIRAVTRDNQEKSNINNNKDIIENLFAKPKSKKATNKPTNLESKEKVPEKKIDLFSDDLFDDIDDIFTSKITKTTDNKKENLFDSDDDLFSEQNIPKPQLTAKKKIVFSDSDDDLFKENEIINVKTDHKENDTNGTNAYNQKSNFVEREMNTSEIIKNEQNDADSTYKDSLTNKVFEKHTDKEHTPPLENDIGIERDSLISSQEVEDNSASDLISDPKSILITKTMDSNESISDRGIKAIKSTNEESNKFKSILDAESDDDLFNDIAIPNKVKDLNLKTTIFDDDSEDELFGNASQISNKQKLENNFNTNEVIENRTNIVNILGEVDRKESISNVTSSNILSSQEYVTPTETRNISIFNDDSDEELFGSKNKKSVVEETQYYSDDDKSSVKDHNHTERNNKQKTSNLTDPTNEDNTLQSIKSNLHVTVNTDFQSPLLFNDDEVDELLLSKPNKPDFIENTPDDNEQSHISFNTAKNLKELIIDNEVKQEAVLSQTEGSVFQEAVECESDVPSDEYSPVGFHENILKESKIVYDTDQEKENSLAKYSDKEIVRETSPFSKIFNDVPPEFEKPKEPKKSKNVNALFDDDSDDETMFFKKSVDVNDELTSPDYSHERFSIFHDEPPAIEVDFTTKLGQNLNNDGEIIDTRTETINSSNTEPKLEPSLISHETKTESRDNNTKKDFQNNYGINVDELPHSLESSIISTNAMIADKISQLQQTDGKKTIECGTKENNIRKLKPVNFNINVNTLLPGAAHKKIKLIEELDGPASSKENKEVEETVRFKEEESAILDNKLSKERVKIQVKRRPSTRRARKEAARKSGIDFGDSIDSTDNSSSIDEPKKDNKTEDSNKKGKLNEIIKNNNSDIIKVRQDENSESSKITTKVVYVLNDEDIFSDDNKNLETDTKSQVDNEIANTSSTGNKHKKEIGIEKKSIFDSSDSETELFGAKNTSVKSQGKLFDSDSDDDDLFGSKKKTTLKGDKQKPLFSDESDGELFSTSKKTENKVSNRPSEQVFEDPLSILNKDDS